MILKIYSLYKRKTKFYFILCILSNFILSISESISIGIIIPIISLIISPNLIFTKFKLYKLRETFDLIGDNQIRIFILKVAFVFIILTTFLKIILFKINTKFASHIGIETAELFTSKILKSKYIFLKTINFDDYLTFSAKNIEFFTYYLVLPFISLISSIFQILFLILLLIYIDIKISFITFLSFSIIYLIFNYLSRKTIFANNLIIKNSTPLIISNMRNILNGFKEIQLYCKSDFYLMNLKKTFQKSFNSQSKSLFLASFPKYLVEAIAMIFLISLLFYKIKSNNITEIIPFLTTFLLALQRLLPSFQNAYSSLTTLKTYSYIQYEVYNTIHKLDINKDPKFNTFKNNFDFSFKYIEFKNINFSYIGDEKLILKSFNTKIKEGDKIFIQGKSGSGKSTFIDLFCGFLPPNSGKILINKEINIIDNLQKWQSLIAYIPQKVHILNGSFYENITYSNDLKQDDLEKCIYYSKLCGLHEIIMEKELGYQHLINSDFNNLSGGQLKRLAIARALFLNKSIIIFDEATAGLDFKSELDIVNMILNLGQNKTILFISHNLVFKEYFNKELILDNE